MTIQTETVNALLIYAACFQVMIGFVLIYIGARVS